MTPRELTDAELRATAESIVDDAENPDPENPYRNSPGALALARAYLAERPADDAEPVTFDWLATQAERHEDQGYWDVPPSGDVWWEAGPISFVCETYQCDPGEPTEVVAAEWQIDGEPLPRMLVPKTRGDFRRLLAALGATPAPTGGRP